MYRIACYLVMTRLHWFVLNLDTLTHSSKKCRYLWNIFTDLHFPFIFNSRMDLPTVYSFYEATWCSFEPTVQCLCSKGAIIFYREGGGPSVCDRRSPHCACKISYGSSTIAFSSSLNFGLVTDRWSESDAYGPTVCTGVLKNGNTLRT